MDHKQALARQILEEAQRLLTVILERQDVQAASVEAIHYPTLKEDTLRAVIPVGPDTFEVRLNLKGEGRSGAERWKLRNGDTRPMPPTNDSIMCKAHACSVEVKYEGAYCPECQVDRVGGT